MEIFTKNTTNNKKYNCWLLTENTEMSQNSNNHKSVSFGYKSMRFKMNFLHAGKHFSVDTFLWKMQYKIIFSTYTAFCQNKCHILKLYLVCIFCNCLKIGSMFLLSSVSDNIPQTNIYLITRNIYVFFSLNTFITYSTLMLRQWKIFF